MTGTIHQTQLSLQSARAAYNENPICHTELKSFIGYERCSRTSEPLAKVNTRERQEAALRITILHKGMTEMALCSAFPCTFGHTFVVKQEQRNKHLHQ